VQIDAVADLGAVPVEETRQIASLKLDRLATGGSPEDKALAPNGFIGLFH